MDTLDLPTRPHTDGWLIARSLTEPGAFHGVFDRHFATVHRYLSRRAGRQVADDLAAQTFLVAFARRDSYRPQTSDARPWLLGIATNLLMNNRRAEQRLLATLEALGTQPGSAQIDPTDRELDQALAAALGSLDPDQRDVLLLYAWGELSYDEIGAALEIPVGTVRSRMSRARAHLQARLDDAAAPTEET